MIKIASSYNLIRRNILLGRNFVVPPLADINIYECETSNVGIDKSSYTEHSVPVSAVFDMEIVSLNKVQHHVHDMCLTYMENFYQPHTKITNLNILQMREDIS